MSPKRRITLEDIGPIIFLTILAGLLLTLLSSGSKNWEVAIILFIFFGFVISMIWYFGPNQEGKLMAAWTELARVTGLTFHIKGKSLLGNLIDPRLEGVYHGRRLSISREIEETYDHEGGGSRTVYTVITIQVTNLTGCSLSVHGKGMLGKIFKKVKLTSGDVEFDARMDILGSPPDFVQRAAQHLAQNKSLLLAGSKETAMLANSLFPWARWAIPVIKLQGPELVYKQQGILKEVQAQIKYLNLLCAIADFVDRQFNLADAYYMGVPRFEV